MSDTTWGNLPVPNIYKELKGEFINFNDNEEYLECKYQIQEKYFNPMNTTLGGIVDSFMDCTMGPLSFLLGEMVVTKTFSAKYIKPVNNTTEYVHVKAWRDSISEKGTIYKAELFLDDGNIAAIAEALFVTPKSNPPSL